jgi:cyclopropane-fatty-acyl-phospholipid synthase
MIETDTLLSEKQASKVDKGARAVVFHCLKQITKGSLVLEEKFAEPSHNPQSVFGQIHDQSISAHVVVKTPTIYARILKGGSIAAAEAYMEGWWESRELTALIRLMVANVAVTDDFESQSSRLKTWCYQLGHWFRRNSIARAKENIHAHYDLGNEMYRLFLDERMLYSSALFHHPDESLEQAQLNKMQRLCEQLDLQPTDRVIEIGSGWGGMAIYMARHYGCHVTTTTISEAQFDFVRQQIETLDLSTRITLLKQDYRLLEGQYDKLVSIEMVEAVGEQYLPNFIQCCDALLKAGGKMVLQAITIADQRFNYYSRHVDFIQKYIFPGGFLPSVTVLLQATTTYSRLVVRDIRDIGLDYARTLKHWRQRFETRCDQVIGLGYDEAFIRMWRYYFCYCEGGFAEKNISTVQMTFEKQR